MSFSGGYKIGYISGKQIKDLGYFTGALPNFAQKTLYKNVILFVASDKLFAGGAVIEDLPFAMSQLADGGYATVGALAAPFGTPIIASSDGDSNHRLAQFSGFSVASTWRSIITPVIKGRKMGFIDEIIVLTKNLASGASCSLKIEANQAQSTSSAMTITTASKRRHIFTSKDIGLGKIEDLRIFLDWSGGSASNDCAIREIIVNGHFVEV